MYPLKPIVIQTNINKFFFYVEYYTENLSTTKPIRNAFLYNIQSCGVVLRNLFEVYRLNSSVLLEEQNYVLLTIEFD